MSKSPGHFSAGQDIVKADSREGKEGPFCLMISYRKKFCSVANFQTYSEEEPVEA